MPTLHRRAEQVLNLESEPGVKLRSNPQAMATSRIALIAQQAQRPARSLPRRLGERDQHIKLVLRVGRCEMALINAQHFLGVSAPRREPTLLGRTELLEMQIGDAVLIEAGRKL